ncbi:hypothetical protein [Micromonospora sp. NPDC049102]|uniref:hypothetical protein n=1 Tax=Micromonospora sp. NPDC049102 TaxID=3364265 RepID=UPI00371848BB
MTGAVGTDCIEAVSTWVPAGQSLSISGGPVPAEVWDAVPLANFHQVYVEPAAIGDVRVNNTLRRQPQAVAAQMVHVPLGLEPGLEAAAVRAEQLGLPVLLRAARALDLSGPQVVPFEAYPETGAVLAWPAEHVGYTASANGGAVAVRRVPAGLVFADPSAPRYAAVMEAAARMPVSQTHLRVFMHEDAGFAAEDIAPMIALDPRYSAPVDVVVCNAAGVVGAAVDRLRSLAATLSRQDQMLGIEVRAASGIVWTSPQGHVIASGSRVHDDGKMRPQSPGAAGESFYAFRTPPPVSEEQVGPTDTEVIDLRVAVLPGTMEPSPGHLQRNDWSSWHGARPYQVRPVTEWPQYRVEAEKFDAALAGHLARLPRVINAARQAVERLGTVMGQAAATDAGYGATARDLATARELDDAEALMAALALAVGDGVVGEAPTFTRLAAGLFAEPEYAERIGVDHEAMRQLADSWLPLRGPLKNAADLTRDPFARTARDLDHADWYTGDGGGGDALDYADRLLRTFDWLNLDPALRNDFVLALVATAPAGPDRLYEVLRVAEESRTPVAVSAAPSPELVYEELGRLGVSRLSLTLAGMEMLPHEAAYYELIKANVFKGISPEEFQHAQAIKALLEDYENNSIGPKPENAMWLTKWFDESGADPLLIKTKLTIAHLLALAAYTGTNHALINAVAPPGGLFHRAARTVRSELDVAIERRVTEMIKSAYGVNFSDTPPRLIWRDAELIDSRWHLETEQGNRGAIEKLMYARGKQIAAQFEAEARAHFDMVVDALTILPAAHGKAFRIDRKLKAGFSEYNGATLRLPSLRSTSASEGVFDGHFSKLYRKTLLTRTVKLTLHLAEFSGRDITPFSVHSNEEERLLLPTSAFEVSSRKVVNGIEEITAHEIAPSGIAREIFSFVRGRVLREIYALRVELRDAQAVVTNVQRETKSNSKTVKALGIKANELRIEHVSANSRSILVTAAANRAEASVAAAAEAARIALEQASEIDAEESAPVVARLRQLVTETAEVKSAVKRHRESVKQAADRVSRAASRIADVRTQVSVAERAAAAASLVGNQALEALGDSQLKGNKADEDLASAFARASNSSAKDAMAASAVRSAEARWVRLIESVTKIQERLSARSRDAARKAQEATESFDVAQRALREALTELERAVTLGPELQRLSEAAASQREVIGNLADQLELPVLTEWGGEEIADRNFERYVGAHLYQIPRVRAVVRMAVRRLRAVLSGSRLNNRRDAQPLRAFVQDDPTSAGQVGDTLSEEEIVQVLNRGNLRMMMTAFYNAAYYKQNEETATLKTVILDIVEDGAWDEAHRLKLNVELLQRYSAQHKGWQRAAMNVITAPIANAQPYAKDPFAFGNIYDIMSTYPKYETLSIGLSQLGKIPRVPHATYKFNLGLYGQTTRRELDDLNVGLHPLEEQYQREAGNLPFKPTLDAPDDEAIDALESRLGEGESGPEFPLPWLTGSAKYMMKSSSAAPWTNSMRQAGIPAVSAISGTTVRLLWAYDMLGLPAQSRNEFLLGITAWMLVTDEHSLYEVLRGAESVGMDLPVSQAKNETDVYAILGRLGVPDEALLRFGHERRPALRRVPAGLVLADPADRDYAEKLRFAQAFPPDPSRLRVFVDNASRAFSVPDIASSIRLHPDFGKPVDVISCDFVTAPEAQSPAAELSKHPLMHGIDVVAANGTVWTSAIGHAFVAPKVAVGRDGRMRPGTPGNGTFHRIRTTPTAQDGPHLTEIEDLDTPLLPGTPYPRLHQSPAWHGAEALGLDIHDSALDAPNDVYHQFGDPGAAPAAIAAEEPSSPVEAVEPVEAIAQPSWPLRLTGGPLATGSSSSRWHVTAHGDVYVVSSNTARVPDRMIGELAAMADAEHPVILLDTPRVGHDLLPADIATVNYLLEQLAQRGNPPVVITRGPVTLDLLAVTDRYGVTILHTTTQKSDSSRMGLDTTYRWTVASPRQHGQPHTPAEILDVITPDVVRTAAKKAQASNPVARVDDALGELIWAVDLKTSKAVFQRLRARWSAEQMKANLTEVEQMIDRVPNQPELSVFAPVLELGAVGHEDVVFDYATADETQRPKVLLDSVGRLDTAGQLNTPVDVDGGLTTGQLADMVTKVGVTDISASVLTVIGEVKAGNFENANAFIEANRGKLTVAQKQQWVDAIADLRQIMRDNDAQLHILANGILNC